MNRIIEPLIDVNLAVMADKGIYMANREGIIADGEIHRFQLNDEDRGKTSGWYVINGNYLTFGSWKGEKYTVKLKQKVNFPPIDRSIIASKIKEKDRNRIFYQDQAATKAWSIWASSADCQSHEYLKNKHVKSHGLRTGSGNLLVPILNNRNQLRSIHFINRHGNKWFFKGGEIKGNYFCIGDLFTSSTVMISEGYATAATLFEVTQIPQVVAFNAGNLVKTAKNIQSLAPIAKLIIAADNDEKGQTNIGLLKGKDAARTVGGKLILPQFLPGDPGTDFNDFVSLYGCDKLLVALKEQGVA